MTHVSSDAGRWAPPARSRALLTTAALAVMLTAADTYVVVLALEEMMSGVGLGLDQLQRAAPIVSGFLLGYIAMLPLTGRLSDLVSRQRVLLWCLVLFGLGSVVTALAVDLPVIVGGRVIQGIGGGGLVPATMALVADLLPRGRRGVALGMVSAVQEVGSVLGPLLGAAVLAVWSWRAIFWVNASAALVLAGMIAVLGRKTVRPAPCAGEDPPRAAVGRGAAAQRPVAGTSVAEPGGTSAQHAGVHRIAGLLGWLALLLGTLMLLLALWAPERLTSDVTYGPPFVPYEGHTSRMATPLALRGLGVLLLGVALTGPLWWRRLRAVDLPGAALLTGALACVVWTFAAADPTKQVVGSVGYWLLPVAALLLAGYLVRHRTAARPLVERGVLSGRVPAALLVSFLVGTALVAVVVEIPVLARLTVTDSQTTAAFVLLRFLVAVPLGALAGGALLRRLGPAHVAAPGLVLAGIGILAMSTWRADALQGLVVSTLVLVVTGLGVGLAIAPVNDAALADSPDGAHGITSALVVVGRMMGMVVGLALLTAFGLHRFSVELATVTQPGEADIRRAGIVQVHSVFLGAGLAALVAAAVAFAFLGRRVITPGATSSPRGD